VVGVMGVGYLISQVTAFLLVNRGCLSVAVRLLATDRSS
jgi:hypothetical protein